MNYALALSALMLVLSGSVGEAPQPSGTDAALEQSLGAEVAVFVDADRAAPPARCQVLFVGSSSIVHWKETLATDMAPMPVINRGFGGSQIEHVNRWFDEIVAPYRPRAIVFYAGENDIDAGKSVERVVADFDQFMTLKTHALGTTPVYFISVKPSKLRWGELSLQSQVNNAIRALANKRKDLHYIDVVTPMLENGKPKEIFEVDGLHMNAKGYVIWTREVRAALQANADAEKRACFQSLPQIDHDGTIHIAAFLLPESSLLTDQTRTALRQDRDSSAEDLRTLEPNPCPPQDADRAAMPAIRKCEAEAIYKTAFYRKFMGRYNAAMTSQTIGGVYTEVFVPEEGIAPRNKDRVLVNLHGGHFEFGSRWISHLESAPIASIGKIKVISIDYRMAPEYAFPAASQDVASVYRELLKSYNPKNIGIYGCSAGGLLTAESIAWLLKEGLPLPAAVGMFGGGATYYQEGDSGRMAEARSGGVPLEPPSEHPYFKDTDPRNALAFPGYSTEVMAKFPPALLIATTRDIGESSVVYTHSVLAKLGVDAQLHVWEGLDHCFFAGEDVPEADDVQRVIVQFFDQHLGK